MGGEAVGFVQPQSPINSQQQRNNHRQLIFQEDHLSYARSLDSNPKAPDHGPARFIEPRCFSLNHQGANLFGERPVRNWEDGRGSSDSSETDEDDDDLDGDEDVDNGDETGSFSRFGDWSSGKSGRDGRFTYDNGNNSDAVKKDTGGNNNGSSSSSGLTALGGMVKSGNGKTEICFSGKDANTVQAVGLSDARATSFEIGNYQNAIAVLGTDGEFYCPHYLNGSGNSGNKLRDVRMDNSNCGFSGRKDFSSSSQSGESLRATLSDPVTGTLMEDAMILPCRHSFGSSGVQQVIRMKACATCSWPILEDSILPNYSLREAVQAFLREEELNFQQPSKRRKDTLEREKGRYSDSNAIDTIRDRGNFRFSVRDRVIINGNKRTPDRFIGREAIVMTQCLNGWYVVKTLDTAECVKLQYRSLARVTGGSSYEVLPVGWLQTGYKQV